MSRFSLIVIFLLSGCQLFTPREAGWTALGAGYYQLLDHWQGQPQQLVQQISWSSGKQQHQFMVSVLLQPDAILVVAISPLGQELWRMRYAQGHQMTLSGIAPFNQPDFARRLLAEMQVALLTDDELAPRLKGLILTSTPDQRRLIDLQHRLVLQIDNPAQTGSGQTIRLQGSDYQLQIVTLQQDFMP